MKKKFKKVYKYIYVSIGVIFLLIGIYKYRYIFLPKDLYLDGPYHVNYVIDGDTIIIDNKNSTIKVRALCIDAPESAASLESNLINTEEGIIASNRAKEILNNKTIYLEYDEEKYDKYGRLLAYIYLEDKKTCFEEIMIKEGLAKVVSYNSNLKHYNDFLKIQNEAKKNNIGFWQTGFYK